jgi:hypothetical protein
MALEEAEEKKAGFPWLIPFRVLTPAMKRVVERRFAARGTRRRRLGRPWLILTRVLINGKIAKIEKSKQQGAVIVDINKILESSGGNCR